MPITIKDVAKYANVSTGTVSRVINNDPGVRPKTRDKVKEAIQQINYVPNATARNLKTAKSMIIGLLISDISNTHFTSIAVILETILREQGYSVIVCNTDDDAKQELDYLYRMMSLQVDGLVLNTTSHNNEYISEISHKVPIVLIERNISNPNFNGDIISSNNFSGTQALTRQLIDCGHRKIGIINGDLRLSTGVERLNGFIETMKEIGVTVDDNYPYCYNSEHFNMNGGIQGCQYLMNLPGRPTAIIVTNNSMATGVYKYLRINNYSVPDDVSVLSYGNIENSEIYYVEPGYATLNPYFIGEKAARYLLTRIQQPDTNNREVIFEPSLIVNQSVKSLISSSQKFLVHT